MNPFKSSISESIDEMETLVSEDEVSSEQDERLQELYYLVQENLKDAFDFDADHDFENDKDYRELKQLKMRFKKVCSEFETPDEITSGTMAAMYPNSDDDDDDDEGEEDEENDYDDDDYDEDEFDPEDDSDEDDDNSRRK